MESLQQHLRRDRRPPHPRIERREVLRHPFPQMKHVCDRYATDFFNDLLELR